MYYAIQYYDITYSKIHIKIFKMLEVVQIVKFVVQIGIVTDLCWSGWTLLIVTLAAIYASFWQ